MAHLKVTPQEFLQQTFSPMIAIASTPGVEAICQKNNLTFSELVRPFTKSTVEATIKDAAGAVNIVRNVRVTFSDINWEPPAVQIARECFNRAISSNMYEKTTRTITAGDTKFDIPMTAPWFEAWRYTFFQVQHPSDHEFTKHFVGCLIVVSSQDPKPMEKIAQMTQDIQDQINQGTNKLPKWFGQSSSILIAYLFLHDNSTSEQNESVPTFEAMNATYGPKKCFMLCINSQMPEDNSITLPDPWAQFISTTPANYKQEDGADFDLQQAEIESALEVSEKSPNSSIMTHPLSPASDDSTFVAPAENTPVISSAVPNGHGMLLSSEDKNRIKKFINEFCLKALIPHFEEQIHVINDQIINKKGVSRSLLSATKRWFTTSKPGTPGTHISPTAIAYSSDSHELQLRRLGDLCFMIGLYSQAFQAYHSAKGEFRVDGAWLHYAGALEMAALAAFMSGVEALSKKVVDYAEESIVTYQNSCRLTQFATRATLLSVDCLQNKGLYGEAAKQLIRMSGEDSDMRSAVLLEQAAYCFLKTQRPFMYRKYAFHMILAGHRFSKASHKLHAMRCYYQAHQVYENKNWSTAEDHILYTIGKLAAQSKLVCNSFEALSFLVRRPSRQSPDQQQIYLKEYVTSVQNMINTEEEEGILAVPVIDSSLIQVLLNVSQQVETCLGRVPASSSFSGSSSDASQWVSLEEKLVNYACGANVMIFKPTIEILTHKTNNTIASLVVKGEPIGMRINLWNPLHIPIKLTNICLLWNLVASQGCEKHGSNCIECQTAFSNTLSEVNLNADSTDYILLMITPNRVGELSITGLSYTLSDASHSVSVDGKQPLIMVPNRAPSKMNVPADKRLQFTVVENAPFLNTSFSGLKAQLLVSEISPVTMHLQNTGSVSISKILLTSSKNFKIWLSGSECTGDGVYTVALRTPLVPKDSIEVQILIQPTFKSDRQNLELLIYYESGLHNVKPKYRLVRHSWPVTVYNIFDVNTVVTRSNAASGDGVSGGLNIITVINANVQKKSTAHKNITIESISMVSTDWKMSQKKMAPQDMQLEKKQSIFLLLKALKKQRSSSDVTTVDFQQNSDPPHSFFIPEPQHETRNGEINLGLVVKWKCLVAFDEDTYTASGQMYVFIPRVNEDLKSPNSVTNPVSFSSKTADDKLPQNEKLVSYQVVHPSLIRHQFTEDMICLVPVVLRLKNRSTRDITIKIDYRSEPDETLELNGPSNRVSWVGKLTLTKDLSGLSEDVIVPLQAAATATGAYELSGCLNVFVKVCNEFVLQKSKPNSVLVIHS